MTSRLTRRTCCTILLSTVAWPAGARALQSGSPRARIVDFGAIADGVTVNTRFIQAAIDHLAGRQGGTVVVPRGIFVSGALFLKPGVHLHLDDGAVLRCTTDMRHFPARRTRIEGHFEDSFTPALLNADRCDGLQITGRGTLDGAGRPVWDRFWALRNAAPNPNEFPNLGLPRARLALIENSRGVRIEDVTFKDSQFWNLHLYRCDDITVRRARFTVPDDYKQAPSTDGIDLDSCRNVLIDGCYFSVTDDCIAAKGTKGPRALEDRTSPPVEHIRIRNCHFRRGHQAFACGSEATIVRDVVIENCRVTGAINVLRLKLRPDTPQRYEDIHVRDIVLDSDGGRIVLIEPWSQYNRPGEVPPRSTVRNVTVERVRGRFGAFGSIRPNPGQTSIADIVFRDIDVTLADGALTATGVGALRFDKVRVNGRQQSAPGSDGAIR